MKRVSHFTNISSTKILILILAWYNLGHAWSCIGEYEKALEALEYSYLINPQFEQAYLDCAELSLQLGQYEKAYRCYHEANDIFGPDTEMIVYMAECLTKLNRHSEAKELLKQSIAQDPYNDEVFFYLGECYTHESNWTKALDCYQEALELDEYREEFHLGAAVANENMGLLKKAEFHYNKAANLGQEQSLYWTDLFSSC
ncbi:MAG: tetratricopeptide repeat protein [Saprospiraceae bacterium]|nr:tetratricopeptide repeat protein [Saprospiraceae bacterium]